MSETHKVNLSDMFEGDFLSTEDRLALAYKDPAVHEWATEIMGADNEARESLRAQLNAYLAAAYALFPEETQVIHDSLQGSKNG